MCTGHNSSPPIHYHHLPSARSLLLDRSYHRQIACSSADYLRGSVTVCVVSREDPRYLILRFDGYCAHPSPLSTSPHPLLSMYTAINSDTKESLLKASFTISDCLSENQAEVQKIAKIMTVHGEIVQLKEWASSAVEVSQLAPVHGHIETVTEKHTALLQHLIDNVPTQTRFPPAVASQPTVNAPSVQFQSVYAATSAHRTEHASDLNNVTGRAQNPTCPRMRRLPDNHDDSDYDPNHDRDYKPTNKRQRVHHRKCTLTDEEFKTLRHWSRSYKSYDPYVRLAWREGHALLPPWTQKTMTPTECRMAYYTENIHRKNQTARANRLHEV
ncbi:hypothetical protein CALCODRAFT_144220 [Calocera cornea HHB12733]|uniref:Uncharacterized protein n=1 Tax=Calocera cornea HHB12733 TaxID=1353952 RepID=A0A165CSP1_9BASI|nr:hypothetical protein CALCODRAFT_144220 [Calocera cornea HHB12733]